jgi:hypothetical protein
MSETESSVNGAAREKIDEDDHDLLTFGEASERLRLEISAAVTEVDRLRSSGSPADLQRSEERLAALRSAARRNSAAPINDANFEKFFGYPGKATRNLPGPPPDA